MKIRHIEFTAAGLSLIEARSVRMEYRTLRRCGLRRPAAHATIRNLLLLGYGLGVRDVEQVLTGGGRDRR